MRVSRTYLAVLCLAVVAACTPADTPPPAVLPGQPRVLVFSRTAGYRHESIDTGKIVLMQLGAANGIAVDTTEDAALITEDSLKHYSAVIFLSPTGNILNRAQEIDLQRFIQAGGGYVGIHAASDAEYDWRWYGRLVGGYFISHPQIQEATLRVMDAKDASTAHLPAEWKRTDEWYNFKSLVPDLHVLLTIDETSYTGGENGATHPMAWYHAFDGGRAWYTELGHTRESYADSLFLKHVLGGIKYAIGEHRALDYAKATAEHPPSDSLFRKVALTMGTLAEPTEMAVLPSGDVLIAQRGGEVVLFRAKDKSVKPAGKVAVYSKSKNGSNVEEGLLGLTIDPGFATNHYVYMFFSPADTSVNRLSRFEFDGDSLKIGSEKVVLQFYSQREICCHTGGSLAFGPGNLLYISAGDNSTPFDEKDVKFASHGFSPTDDRPGHEPFDARRSSANSNDLRGKILRIRIKPDGTYEIPPGNLFAPGTPNTKPEIFVMGNRNPYRISVDQKSGFLYWGEVGPDAADDTLATRGPRGYDEVNQARVAGNFGWPLFVGNNYAYHKWNYATGESGPVYDAAAPKNESLNNTGIRDLPPAQPAFIWYPYGDSHDFPQVGKGGRTAMAGPVYHFDLFTGARGTALPQYYDGKFFIYDWIRHWIMAVTLRPNGDYEAMEPFAPRDSFSAPIDMEMGPDGRIYVLEYGKAWFAKNADAGLSMIEYRGKR
ncbi:MAG: ThuA domain-containing protein [Gemmatimonadaceae bacterium]|nr:ThuA domain-containing protein [Gemmatimonadaceae bacterium]